MTTKAALTMNLSKTKLGGVLLGLSVVLPAVAQALQDGQWHAVLQPAVEGLGVILAAFGLRNALAVQRG